MNLRYPRCVWHRFSEFEELDKAGLDGRKATQAIRQEYQTRRDLELKEEYAKKRAAQPAGGQPAGG